MTSLPRRGVLAALAVSPLAVASPALAAPSRGHDRGPRLVARATLPSDHLEEGPVSGAAVSPANGVSGPFDGQVVPGFSAAVEIGDGSYWAMPDNGFGAKTNSADFLLRIYRATPRWETSRGGAGTISLDSFVSLKDPRRVLDFPIVHEHTEERLLTGADLDVESLVLAKDGSFWIGEEFGPFLLHADADGALLEAPVPLPGGLRSPQSPSLEDGETPSVRASKGFEALAASPNGKILHPILEGYLPGEEDQHRVEVLEFDVRRRAYTDRRWTYRTDLPGNLVGDAFALDPHRLLILERDDVWGPGAVTKKVYRVDLRRTDADGTLEKTLVIDLLAIPNPDGIGLVADPGAYGVGETFSFPMQSVETVVLLEDGRLLIANDNNYPSNDARCPGTPDDTEMILIDLGTRRGGRA
ncbi:esterase-like activity of phytase family protein [Brachybacterium rhamnosum]|uniref:Esterase-like activity of phytase family protein n=1 Tax=Brachybacterium rhamnosum TaxID=173361 RepID=A0ABW4Q1U4_9MICO